MMSKFPWKLDENDPSIIYDADGDVIAKDYTFVHLDDFEGLVKLINNHIYNSNKAILSKEIS